MNVLLTAVSFSDWISGVQRHAFNLARALLLRPEIDTVHMVIAPWQLASVLAGVPSDDPRFALHILPMQRSAMGRNLWHIFGLPGVARRLNADVVHLTCPVPLNASAIHVPIVTTLHDLYPYEVPENFGHAKAAVQRCILRHCLSHSQAIACVSNTTASQLHHYLPSIANAAQLTRIYNAVEPYGGISSECPLPSLGDRQFLLCVAQHRKNKNMTLLLGAISRMLRQGQLAPRTQLLIIGIPGPETAALRSTALDLGLTSAVHFLDGLSEARLHWCYRNAQLLILASKTEGFGLPVAEALLNGCRVVCSDLPVLHEVGAQHCRYFSLDGDAEENLIQAIRLSLSSDAPAPVAFPQFSLPSIGLQYVDLYRRLLARVPSYEPLLPSPSQPERTLL